MSILYFLPAIGWGFMPIVASLTAAKPINQLVGTTTMALLVSLIFSVWQPATYNEIGFMVAFFSGCFWSIGQYLQFQSFQWIQVSEAMPISNGTQLIGTTVIAVFVFHEWTNMHMFVVGILGLISVILGIYLISYKDVREVGSVALKKRALLYLGMSSIALTIYVTLPQAFQVDGSSIFLPQALGMWCSSIVFVKKKDLCWIKICKNFMTGLCWSVANISLFLVMPILGVAKSFTFSQFAVLISLYASLFILKIQKKPREIFIIFLGSICMTIGILLIGSIK